VIRNLSRGTAALGIALLVAGCAAPAVVPAVKAGDAQLSCEQLQGELAAAQKARAAGEAAQGSTGGNIVKAIIWIPSLLISHSNGTDAVEAADARKAEVTKVMASKKCPAPKDGPPARPGA
jgi:hypothetical protein